MKIPFNVLDRQFFMHQEEYENKAIEVLRSGWYILGKEVEKFEKEFADYLEAKFCISVDNGLNAIVMAFRALNIGKGDEVIVQGNTYIASVMGISMNGATPIFVEPNDFYNIDDAKIEEKITPRTKAILVTHLYGQATKMDKILEICKKYNIELVEDCAQAHGATYKGRKVGTFGIGCFSFYPSKNLGCFGDGGAIVTHSEELMKKFKVLRNYGSQERYQNEVVGYNSRLDEIQAGLLRVKLKYLSELNNERRIIAERYLSEIKNTHIVLPKVEEDCSTIWHLFVIRCSIREKLQKYLADKGISTVIHYPIPPHLSEAYQYLGYKNGDFKITENYAETILSLPLYNGMKEEEIEYVIRVINEY